MNNQLITPPPPEISDQQDANSKNPEISPTKYRELKDQLHEIEKQNHNQIILIPCAGNKGWYEMAEHSALFYYYKICEPLNLKVNLESDQDSYYKPYAIGRIRIRDPKLVKTRIETANLLKNSQIKNHCHIFTLKLNLTKTELENLKTTELNRRAKNRDIIKIHSSDPILHFHLIEASKRLHEACATKLDKLTSQQNGARIVNLIDGIILEYYHVCNQNPSQKAKETKKLDPAIHANFLEKINRIIYEVQLLSEVGLWGTKTSLSIISPILELKKLLEKRLR